MKVKIGTVSVDVLDRECSNRPCYWLGYDKGSYSQGRGYTSYHKNVQGRRVEFPVCMTRHLRGCPSNSVCHTCRTISVRPPGQPCGRFACSGLLVPREGDLVGVEAPR